VPEGFSGKVTIVPVLKTDPFKVSLQPTAIEIK
jgi:hypothetical protein